MLATTKCFAWLKSTESDVTNANVNFTHVARNPFASLTLADTRLRRISAYVEKRSNENGVRSPALPAVRSAEPMDPEEKHLRPR